MRRHVFSAKGAALTSRPGAASQDSWHAKKTLALKARFTGDVIRYIIDTVFISRGYFFGLRTITELNRAFSAWLPG